MKQHGVTNVILAIVLATVGAFLIAPVILAEGPGPKAQSQPPAASTGGGNTSGQCLTCHGPFGKLTSAPPFFVAPSGEKINPHRYVPHDLKDIPDCVSCHKPHSAEPTAAELAALPKPTVESCFECHHKRNFVSCQECHKR
jgi:hypothetical protein